MSVSIVSFNLNGIRSAISKGLLEWLETHSFDVVCFQELKADISAISVQEFERLGYNCYWFPAQKKGYSGVAILSKKPAKEVLYGCGMELYDYEGRIVQAIFNHFSVFSCYFPSGTSGDERQSIKMTFLDDFLNWISPKVQEQKSMIVCGDYNIAHNEIDIHDPKGNKNNTGFLPEERAWMTKWFQSGFSDAFRGFHPEKVEYSWWSFRAAARSKNKGWRIDYQSVTPDLIPKIKEVKHMTDVYFSDHCPVLMILDEEL